MKNSPAIKIPPRIFQKVGAKTSYRHRWIQGRGNPAMLLGLLALPVICSITTFFFEARRSKVGHESGPSTGRVGFLGKFGGSGLIF